MNLNQLRKKINLNYKKENKDISKVLKDKIVLLFQVLLHVEGDVYSNALQISQKVLHLVYSDISGLLGVDQAPERLFHRFIALMLGKQERKN